MIWKFCSPKLCRTNNCWAFISCLQWRRVILPLILVLKTLKTFALYFVYIIIHTMLIQRVNNRIRGTALELKCFHHSRAQIWHIHKAQLHYSQYKYIIRSAIPSSTIVDACNQIELKWEQAFRFKLAMRFIRIYSLSLFNKIYIWMKCVYYYCQRWQWYWQYYIKYII